jgi:acyl-homoserine-lactone acylase
MGDFRQRLGAAGVAAALVMGGCSGSNTSSSSGTSSGGSAASYNVTVTRTTYGIPHVQANDWPSLGYGYGYAFAQDNLCTMMEEFVTIRGERSKYFGGDGSYSIPSVPVTANNVDADFFFKLIADDTEVQYVKNGADPNAALVIQGYVDGFNRYMSELKGGQHSGAHQACATAAYLQPISTDDLYRRFVRLAAIGSSEALITEIATAAPPKGSTPSDQQQMEAARQLPPKAQAFATLRHENRKFGSNMYGIGGELTDSGQPILFGNPHFPWNGPERLYAIQLTMGDQLNVEGASLYGAPVVLIGFNDHVAWSHTVSTAYRFTMYDLTLNPSNPMQYTYDGKTEDITAVPLSVDVLNKDGSTTTQTRTLYRSKFGPMFIIKQFGIPILGWTKQHAFTLRDANLENNRLINQWFAWDQATSLDQFKQLHGQILGVPWVNTIAAGPDGHPYYGDISVVPAVPDDLAASCSVSFYSSLINAQLPGLPLLDGSKSSCEWDTKDNTMGLFGSARLPTLNGAQQDLDAANDWVANSNDSYWLTNPTHPITHYSRIIGDEATARSLRTRMGITQLQNRLAGTDGRPGKTFNPANLEDIVLHADVYSGILAQQSVLSDACPSGKTAYDLSTICGAITQWDRRATLSSIGMTSWTEFWNDLDASGTSYWGTPFSASDPVNTPNTLNTASPTVLTAVGKALNTAQTTIKKSGSDISAPFGQLQYSGANNNNGQSIPVFGGEGEIGAFTVADTSGDDTTSSLTKNGYPIVFGNSYIQVVTWNSSGNVSADGFLSYSESTDPANPHYSDFSQAYEQQQWYHFPFTPDEIAADAKSTVTLTQ